MDHRNRQDTNSAIEGVWIMALRDANPKKFGIKSRVWIEDEEGKIVFGAGRLRILELIEAHGSILAAAKELQMSYRAVWGKIKATEDRLGQQLVRRKPDGTTRGGSELTPFACTIMDGFRQLQTQAEKDADQLFQTIFTPDLNPKDPPPDQG
jgi:molybdate transport system regulatory protein